MKVNKPILAWTIEDLEILRDDPYNLEDMNIEYKEQYNGDADELRKDIVSFANSETGGYILFGVRDDPFELIGISRKEVDNLKTTIGSVINTKIDPHLDPPPITNPISLPSTLFILGVQIFPKKKGVYAIRESNSPNSPYFQFYSFWIRSDGYKRQLPMEEVNSYIIETDPYKKKLEVSVEIDIIPKTPTYSYFNRMSTEEQRESYKIYKFDPDLGERPKYLIIKGVNKLIRSISIEQRYILLYDHQKDDWVVIYPKFTLFDPMTIFNTPTDTEILLKDSESIAWHYPLKWLKEGIKKHKSLFPIRIKVWIHTKDGMFYSKERELKDLESEFKFKEALLTGKDLEQHFKDYLERKEK